MHRSTRIYEWKITKPTKKHIHLSTKKSKSEAVWDWER
jgi:hypothetical protein